MRTQYSNEITAELEGKEVVLSGWAHEIRDLGKLKFLILRDQEGFIQVCAKEGSSPHEVLAAIKAISKESVVRVKGKVKVSPQAPGGAEIVPDSINIISKSLSPLPLDVTGKVPADLDTRLNNRFMDLRKPEIASIFKIRDQILSAGRESFENEGFIELHTPKIIASASEGGTELFPISYFDKEAFLAQSPQLYKQMMMATGFDKVYEVTYYFRAEEHDTIRHLNEVTAFDSEISFIKDEEDVIGRVERLVRDIIKRASECETELKILNDYHSKSKKEEIKIPVPEIPFRRIPYDKALDLLAGEGKKVEWGEDLDTESEKMLGRIVKEKFGNEFYFLTKYPLGIKPFYTMPALGLDDPCGPDSLSRAFDLDYKGVEVCSGSQRIHDYDLLFERLKYWNLNPDNFNFYLNAFRYGMPPHGGFGLGVDRIMMQLIESNIREVVLFPRDRHRLTP